MKTPEGWIKRSDAGVLFHITGAAEEKGLTPAMAGLGGGGQKEGCMSGEKGSKEKELSMKAVY